MSNGADGGMDGTSDTASDSTRTTASQRPAEPVTEDLWKAVDAYLCEALIPADPALEIAWRNGVAADLPMHASVSPLQGRLLQILVRSVGAERVLEIGTLGGYSTIWLARGLTAQTADQADGKSGTVLSLELREHRADIARDTIRQAGLAEVVEVRTGPAVTALQELIAEHVQPFDVVFIDGDKQNNARYFELALQLTRPGSLILVDNIVRRGAVLDDASTDTAVQGVRELISRLEEEPTVAATVIPTLTRKGYDGLLVATVSH